MDAKYAESIQAEKVVEGYGKLNNILDKYEETRIATNVHEKWLESRLESRRIMIDAQQKQIKSLRNDLRILEDTNRLLVNALKEINLDAHAALTLVGE